MAAIPVQATHEIDCPPTQVKNAQSTGCLIPDIQWLLGNPGDSCDTVCAANGTGRTCVVEALTTITSETIFKDSVHQDHFEGTECPPSHPFVYHGGSHCCKVGQDRNGNALTYFSNSCLGESFIGCPTGADDGNCAERQPTQCSSYLKAGAPGMDVSEQFPWRVYAAPFLSDYFPGVCMYSSGQPLSGAAVDQDLGAAPPACGLSEIGMRRFCPCTCAAATPYSCGTNAVCKATTTPTCVLPGQDASGQEASSTGGATVGAGAGADTAGVGAGTAGAGAADGGAAQDASSTGSGASITIGSGSIKLGSGSIKFGNEL